MKTKTQEQIVKIIARVGACGAALALAFALTGCATQQTASDSPKLDPAILNGQAESPQPWVETTQ